MNAQAAGRNGTNATIVAIRTPEEFIAAFELALESLNRAMRARSRGSEDATRLEEEAASLAQAVTGCAFQLRGSEVVAKGFTPRLVA